MTSNSNPLAQSLPSDEALSGLREGDTFTLPPQAVPGTERGSKPLTAQWVIEVATGERAQRLDQAQSTAIRALLAWAATERSRQDESDGQPEHTPG